MKNFDFIDIVLGVCLIVVTVAMVMGKASIQDVLTFAAGIGLKKAPSTLGQ